MSGQEAQPNFGFKFGRGGAHLARTMMFIELEALFSEHDAEAALDDYKKDIVTFNALHKPTEQSRKLSYKHLCDLYGLCPSIPLFRVFRRLWDVDDRCRPVLACQMAVARDPLLKSSQEKILSIELGAPLKREEMEAFFSERYPDRFSPAMLKSLAQNINGTWTAAGYLEGRARKKRACPLVRPANVAFALFQGYLRGVTGGRLFGTDWIKLLDQREETLLEMARQASNSGLLSFKHSSDVIEVTFPDYLTKDEEARIHE